MIFSVWNFTPKNHNWIFIIPVSKCKNYVLYFPVAYFLSESIKITKLLWECNLILRESISRYRRLSRHWAGEIVRINTDLGSTLGFIHSKIMQPVTLALKSKHTSWCACVDDSWHLSKELQSCGVVDTRDTSQSWQLRWKTRAQIFYGNSEIWKLANSNFYLHNSLWRFGITMIRTVRDLRIFLSLFFL